jgi:microcystin-dependent protein
LFRAPTRVDDDPSRAVIYNPIFQRRSQDGSGGRDGGRGNDSSTDAHFEYEEPSLAAAPVPIMRSVNSTPNTSQGTKSTATCWVTTAVLIALALSVVGVVLGSMSASGRGSTSPQQAGSSMAAPASDASVVVDMRELVANMTLLRELVQAQADTIVFLEARVRILEETSAPTLVPPLTPTSVPTSAPTFAPSHAPTTSPTEAPTLQPTYQPTGQPTQSPTSAPTALSAAQIVPEGVVVWFASSSPPRGYLICDGRGVSRIIYPALFAVIGTTFGAPSTTTFNLPDLRGEFIRGIDGGRGVDTGRVFGTLQPDAFQTHNHTTFVKLATTGHVHQLRGSTAAGPVDTTQPVVEGYQTGTPSTGNYGTETRPRNVALLPCIKM